MEKELSIYTADIDITDSEIATLHTNRITYYDATSLRSIHYVT